MKCMLALLAPGLLLAGGALADYPAYLGFYFDQDATICQITTDQVLQGYLIVTDATFDHIKGLECSVDWEELGTVFLGMVLPYGGLNVGDHHDVVIGLAAPLATGPATVMATYNLAPLGPTTYFDLGAADPPSIEGILPVVVDGADNMFQIGVTYCSYWGRSVINPPVDAQHATWGTLKSLYR